MADVDKILGKNSENPLVQDVNVAMNDSQVEEELSFPTEEPEMDLPNSKFFDDDESQSSNQPKADNKASEAPKTEIPTIVKYKADGKEYTLDLSTEDGRKKAIQALSLQSGARKAFSEADRLKREIKKYKDLEPKYQEQSKIWEQLESLRGDPKALFEVVSGQKYDEFLGKEIERKRMRELADPEQLKMYDELEEAKKLKYEMNKIKAEHEKQKQMIEEQTRTNEVKSLESSMHPVFEKYSDFEQFGHSDAAANSLRKMLWRNSVDDLKEYAENNYDVTPKLIAQVFNHNAKLLRGNEKVIENKVQEKISKKKEEAQKQAQVASTTNYPKQEDDLKELSKLNPLDLFKKLRGK